MCAHHWMVDSCDNGVCKKCGKEKNFSKPWERLTGKEVKLARDIGNAEYYMQGILHVSDLMVK